MSAFKILVRKLMKKGHSEESAKRIAAAIGRAKYGKAGMAAKAAAGRRKLSLAFDPSEPRDK